MIEEYGSLATSYIERMASLTPQVLDGDYFIDDVLYCGKCQTAKQAWVDWIPDKDGKCEKRLVSVMCRCEQERFEAEEAAFRKAQFEMALSSARDAFGLFERGTEQITFAGDDDVRSPISRTCRKYVEKWEEMRRANIGILFYGNKGTGKSFYASCIANALADKMIPTTVVTTASLIGAAQGKAERAAIIDHLNHFSLVVLDDLGAERDTSYGAEVLYSIIDARYRAGKPLIVTTNLDEGEMHGDTDPMRSRIYDRVLEMCSIPLKMLGESRRSGIADRRRELARELLRGGT